jgi:hypothetical protein
LKGPGSALTLGPITPRYAQREQLRRLAAARELTPNSAQCVASMSFRLDTGQPNHLAPFLGFQRDELAEVGRQAAKHRAVQVGKPRLDVGIGKAGIDLPVQLVDDLGRCS